jgi:DNA-binding response OmpR family regulator
MAEIKVLLVDDEEEFVNALAERLRLRGFEVQAALEGAQALQAIEADPPGVIVLDVLMPGLSGLDVLKQLKALNIRIPVIMLTGRGATPEGIEGMRLGAFDYLVKPVSIEELIKKIQAAIESQP